MGFNPVHLLEDMIIELIGGAQQPPEEVTCLSVLTGKKSMYRIRAKGLVEKPPVQSPSISIWQKHSIEPEATPVMRTSDQGYDEKQRCNLSLVIK